MSNWIKWEGGECPVKKGTLIDVKYRGGDIQESIPALQTHNKGGRVAVVWGHYWYGDGNIVAYRLSESESHVSIEQLLTKANKHAKKAAKHEEKRLALIEQAKELLPEGYELNVLGEMVEAEPAEDMTDPSNWQAGDVVECVNSVPFYTEGRTYTLLAWDHNGKVLSSAGEILAIDNMMDNYYSSASNFKWISRPNKETN